MELTRSRFLALLGAGAATLAGCAEAPPPLDVSGASFGDRASGTVAMWCRGSQQATTRALIDRFHRAQNGIRIRLTPVQDGQYVTKLATAMRGGREPDLVDIDDINSALFIHRGVFADLTPLIDRLPFRRHLSPGHLALAERDGRFYGIPSIADNSALWCNMELFDKARIDIDEATGSFEGYLDAARAVSALGKDVYGWYLPGNSSGALAFTVQPHVWAGGAGLITGPVGRQRGDIVGNEPLRRTLTFLHTLWSEQLVPRACFSDDGTRWTTAFHTGKVAMLPISYGLVHPTAPEGLRDDLTVRLLAGPNGGRAFFDGGNNFCIPNGSGNPAAAWDFIRFCLDGEQQSKLPETGYIPVRADVATPAFRGKYPLAAISLNDIDAGQAPLSLAYNRIFNQNDGPWLAMIRRAAFGGEIDAAMNEAQQRFDEVLRQGGA